MQGVDFTSLIQVCPQVSSSLLACALYGIMHRRTLIDIVTRTRHIIHPAFYEKKFNLKQVRGATYEYMVMVISLNSE